MHFRYLKILYWDCEYTQMPKKTPTDKLANPHDKLFREIWSDAKTAREFLIDYLPEKVKNMVDLNTLEISKDSFIEKELKDYYSDILYKVKFNGKPGFIYLLFEHKSYTEHLIHLQLLEYMLKIWRLHIKQTKKKRLPVIVPMVLYHGSGKWSVDVSFS